MLRQLAFVILVPSVLAAQQPPTAPLKPANATLTAGFANVMAMHELSDRRVLLTDMVAKLVGVGDFATGKFVPTPNVNAGPMVALAGDSSLMWGLQHQWVFFVGATPIGMLPADNPVVAAAPWVYGADSMGYLLTIRGGTPSHGDSTAVVRIARSTAEQDTVAWLWNPPSPAAGASPAVYRAWEQMLLTIDGWIAVLRTAPYRVDWRTPDGHWVLGAPIPSPVVKLDDREKRAYMAQHARGETPKSPETITNWPDTVAPWESGYPPIASLDGKLLVLRTPTADFPGTRYDVINRRGTVERQITMAANEKILGFGSKSVYIRANQKDGSQIIQRHPWP